MTTTHPRKRRMQRTSERNALSLIPVKMHSCHKWSPHDVHGDGKRRLKRRMILKDGNFLKMNCAHIWFSANVEEDEAMIGLFS